MKNVSVWVIGFWSFDTLGTHAESLNNKVSLLINEFNISSLMKKNSFYIALVILTKYILLVVSMKY